MSDEGEKTCPLCAEDMDLTDQQLKPCRCGYEICVWCWHHIMDMAEKDDTEGRCPACRSPYDREKIVGMAAKCERLVAEISMEKKLKTQKAKTKLTEGRKQLSSVRVIQRNLVYVVGLPLNLADEDLLQRRDYFGQYGKVLKVSMSRTTTGVVQQFPNNTCSVYITYSKEDEAIRCIQNVHQFVLEGKPLRACFGTTKYCHAWLRNVPCTNPDCLYLHEIGSQEDSFTKDEIISAYTRSRVQQITGAAHNMQRRSGNCLPPPFDDYCNNGSSSSGKPIIKSPSSNAGSTVRDSPPNESATRSMALPAAASWGMRGSNCQQAATSLASLNANGPAKPKPDTATTLPFSSAVAGTALASPMNGEAGKRSTFNGSATTNTKGKPESLSSLKSLTSLDHWSYSSETLTSPEEAPASVTLNSQLSGQAASNDNHKAINMSLKVSSVDYNDISHSSSQETEGTLASDEHIQNLSSDMSYVNINRDIEDEYSNMRLHTPVSDNDLIKAPASEGTQEYFTEQPREPLTSTIAGKGATLINGAFSREKCDWASDFHKVVPNRSEVEEDVVSFGSRRFRDAEAMSGSPYLSSLASSFNGLNHVNTHSLDHSEAAGAYSLNDASLIFDKKFHGGSSSLSATSNIYPEDLVNGSATSDMSFAQSLFLSNEGRGRHMERIPMGGLNADGNDPVDKGESSIISNILSMDYDVWNDSLTSPQNLAKLLGETDKQSGSLKVSSSWKGQNNSQSRFSFARQEESLNQELDIQASLNVGQLQKNYPFGHSFSENENTYLDKLRIPSGLCSADYDGFENHSSGLSAISSNKLSVSRAQISAPPGFSVPNRAPPPGFSSHERVDQLSDPLAGNNLVNASSLLRNLYQAPHSGPMVNTGDIEFMDPAILAVGKGRVQVGLNNPGLDMRSNFPPQSGSFENDARLQLLMQRSLSPQQNLRFSDVGDGLSHLNDSYGISRLVDQSQVNNISPFAQMSVQHSRNGLMSNGHWAGWNEVQGSNSLGMSEILRNDRMGFNKFYNSYEDSKFRMPSSSDLYHRTFGM